MAAVLTLHQSTIGKKVIMATSGLVLVAYVVVHMLGNLKVYQGQAKMDAYAAFLRDVGSPVLAHEQLLWLVRIVLLAALISHVWAAVSLSRLDLASRPVRYHVKKSAASGYAVWTMRWGGLVLGLFIIYHLLHLTSGTVHPSFREGAAYANLVSGFRVWYVALFYIAAMLALALHLYHGVWSTFQTLGLNDVGRDNLWRGTAVAIAVAVSVGNISIPLAVLTGFVR
ncbi:MAG: succinate dehydrogenase cytochrome b subunit [Chloroflexota bacterium]